MTPQTEPRINRSPLKDRPLRNPGQSVQELIDDKLIDAFLYFMAPVLIFVIAGMEWVRAYRRDTFHPWLYLSVGIVAAGVSFLKYRRILAELRSAKLGRDGERIVAEFLDPLRKCGYEILHDVVGGNFNVDHVVIGPTGVFVIETKTRSKSGGPEE